MSQPMTRSTIYFEPDLHKTLRHKAVSTQRSLSALVNEAVRTLLAEDQEDLAAFAERAAEPLIDYETFVSKLRADGKL
ncbi:MAG: CopG family transcriptional regulator [Trichlorobacter sp.]|nr:CopG family transcriptional regulator [Trichlorobacter sp.]